nr:RNA-directed DNA polymerase, eukaryota [Tanacetum cinerariifolium]
MHDFKQRLKKFFGRPVNWVHVLDFVGLTEEMRQTLADRLRMVYTRMRDKSYLLATHRGDCLRSGDRWFESLCLSSSFILDLGLHTAEEMAEDGFEAYWLGSTRSIPDKGDLRDYWIEISSDRDFLGAAPSYVYIRDPMRMLCHEMISYSIYGRGQEPKKGRNNGARMFGRHFIGRLVAHFGLVSGEGLMGSTVIARKPSMIDTDELVKLNLCVRLVPMQAHQPPLAVAPTRTIAQRLQYDVSLGLGYGVSLGLGYDDIAGKKLTIWSENCTMQWECKGRSNEEISNTRAILLKELQDINTAESVEMAQRYKIRWAIEGDENSKYFYGIIKQKRSQLAICGVLIDGTIALCMHWINFPQSMQHDLKSFLHRLFFGEVSESASL